MLLTLDHGTYVSLYSNRCCEDVAPTYIEGGDRWCVHCLEVTEEPGLSRRSPAYRDPK
ncbi:hypothetical protein Scep_020300 [Stephania cephalantha]|uniref:Uncharacterized protein n=1 Tax=Stephania cephalantha TaxID=152367 RepID=A0AAP0NQP5_9MAGN